MKLVILVRSDLGMSVGKVAAQCSHAAVDAALGTPEAVRRAWDEQGQPIIVLQGETEQTMCADTCSVLSRLLANVVGGSMWCERLELAQRARALQLPVWPIRDAGRTEVAPDTLTVMGIGPGTPALSCLSGASRTHTLHVHVQRS